MSHTCNLLDAPKSANLIFPLESRKMLAPLISLCTILLSWRYDTPSNICRVYFLVKISLSAPVSRKC